MSDSLSLPDREECYNLFREARFGEKVNCIECKSCNIIKRGTTSKDAQRYQCKDCNNYFNDLSETTFENRQLAIEQLAYIIQNREHKSAEKLADALGENKSAIVKFLRQIEKKNEPEYLKVLSGLDFSLLMAGDMLSPFVGEENVDPQSDAFSQWIMSLAYDD